MWTVLGLKGLPDEIEIGWKIYDQVEMNEMTNLLYVF